MNKKLVVRVIACILAVLMLLGSVVMIIGMFGSFTYAEAEQSEDQVIEDSGIGGEEISTDTPAVDTPATEDLPTVIEPPKYDEFLPHIDECNSPVRVGVFYIYSTNNCLAFSHNIKSENGLMFYSEYDEEYTFFHSSSVPVTIMRDFSAAKNSSGTYYHTTSANTHIIYHCVTANPVEKGLLNKKIEQFKEALGNDTAVFPLYIGNNAHIAVGTYSDKAASEADCQNMQALLGEEFSPRTPNNTSISVIETDSGKILFKIDTSDCRLFVRPMKADGQTEDAYIKSSVGNIFDGTFEYKATIDGLYLVNILDLEDYIKSVLPYEISASWPVECLKAFSIIVRSYTLSNLSNNHRNEDFDMCDETHCQAYRGRLRSTKTTDAAVEATNNIVLAYDSKICKTFYHAISGGVTEASENVWYDAYDYLKPVEIPSEKYWNYTYGEWSHTIPKSELFSYLQNNSSVAKKISGSIKSVRISEYTPSGYAYKLEITDENGNVATFTKTDTIRTMLSKYCKSARISIGKIMEVDINDSTQELDAFNFYQTDSNGNPVRFNASATSPSPTHKTVLTANGETTLSPSTEMITISGTGWGHGVGLSQYGARDMALEGKKWTEIATYFFPGAYLSDLTDLSTPLYTEETEENAKPPNASQDKVEDLQK